MQTLEIWNSWSWNVWLRFSMMYNNCYIICLSFTLFHELPLTSYHFQCNIFHISRQHFQVEWKLSGEIHKYMQISNVLKSYFSLPKIKVTLTNSSINHLNPNFAHLGRGNINVFKHHGLVWLICHRSFITKSHMNSQSPNFDFPKFKANHNSIHHPLARCNRPMYE